MRMRWKKSLKIVLKDYQILKIIFDQILLADLARNITIK